MLASFGKTLFDFEGETLVDTRRYTSTEIFLVGSFDTSKCVCVYVFGRWVVRGLSPGSARRRLYFFLMISVCNPVAQCFGPFSFFFREQRVGR